MRMAVTLCLSLILSGCSAADEPSALDELVRQSKDLNPNMRYSALEQLGNLGPKAETKTVVPTLIEGLSDKDANVRLVAAYALAKVGPAAASAVTPLAKRLSDPDKQVRLAAAYALPALGDAAQSSLPQLEQRARDPDPEVRTQAARSAKSIRTAARVRQTAKSAEQIAATDPQSTPKPETPRSRRRK